MILTEATLIELHGELVERLKMAHGKPLMVSITYKDNNDKLQHWMGRNNDFSWDDTDKTTNHYVSQAEKVFKPRNLEVVQDFKKQLKVRKRATIRG